MKKAVIYARYSSDKQDDVSIEAQVRACREYAAKNGYDIVKVYADEAISGKGSKTASRRQYQAMLRDCERNQFDAILIHKYDRAARNVGEHVNLEMRLSEHNVSLIAVAQDFGSSKEAKIMKTMMWALSEYYIDNLSDEVRKGMKEVALKGLHTGGYAPFGYDIIDKQYVINETEAHYVRKMFQCAAEKKGFVDLIDEMARNGITGKRGKPIKYTQIYEILRNKKYTGEYAYSLVEEKVRTARREKPNAIKIENALPKIIDKALFNEVQAIMNSRKQTGKKSNYLCSGLVYCGKCGAKMHGTTTRRKGYEYRKYVCSGKCGAGTVDMDKIDNFIKEYVSKLLSDETQSIIANRLREYAKGEKFRISEFNQGIKKQIAEKQEKIDGYMDAIGRKGLPDEFIIDISNKISALKDEIKSLQELPIPKDYTVPQIKNWLDSLKKSSSDRDTVILLVERIEATKTAVKAKSTLEAVLSEIGCGGSQHILPTILFVFKKLLG